MQTLISLNPLDFYILFAIAVVLITLEVFLYSFVVVWFALGFIVVGLLSIYFEPFSSLLWQLASISLISIALMFIFRKKVIDKFLKPKIEVKDNFFDEKGIAQIKNSKIYYKGTYWDFDSSIDEKEFKEGEKVEVLKTFANKALIKKSF